MAMEFKGAVTLPAPRATVWAKLNDPEVLKACIKSLHALDRVGDATFAATVKIKIGPIGATFRGVIELTQIEPPNGYRINGAGEGGIAGFAKGYADVSLADEPDGTRLTYDVQADLGGRIARMGVRLMDGLAQRTIDQFFANFAAQCVT